MAGNDLIQLIYLSNSTQFDSNDKLQELLKVARRNNSRLGVTGMLLYHEGTFLQVLEGEEAVVDALYARIKQDDRHRACMKVARVSVDAREFGNWSMGFQRPEGSLLPGFSGFMNDYRSYEPERLQSEAYNLMLKFRQRALANSDAA
ncbi:MAG TPA: BLUF domain-containing protein [Pseudomonadales bacterium]